ncbi:DMT family transporter [Herbiconiux daphne]|uniref:DMT family transporter n=1 Tax=Herbiconiux daphne TaxID=2970914 RepID=A0ABT2H2N1_9MICO|nr:DMT family transporter [Herbiconiux daphne]MCS5734167.1 DMT family transporter [Herbiconiux daphne]
MLPYLAVVLAAVCFGTTGTAQAFGPVDASAGSIGAARILIGGGLLGVVGLLAWWRGRGGQAPAARPSPSARRLPAGVLVAIGALGVLAYQPAFFAGTSENGVAVGTVVALGSAPILTGLLDWLLSRRFPGVLWLVATLIATVGVVLISGLLGQGPVGSVGTSATDAASALDAAGATDAAISVPGLLASVAAGASYAVYTLAGKALLERGWAPTATMGAVFGVAAVLSLPLLLTTDTAWLATGPGLAMALWLGVVTTVVAYLLFGWGLKRLPASTVSTLTLAEPLTATLLGTLVLGETLQQMAVIGLVVLAAGLVVLTIPRRPRHPELPRSASAAAPS